MKDDSTLTTCDTCAHYFRGLCTVDNSPPLNPHKPQVCAAYCEDKCATCIHRSELQKHGDDLTHTYCWRCHGYSLYRAQS